MVLIYYEAVEVIRNSNWPEIESEERNQTPSGYRLKVEATSFQRQKINLATRGQRTKRLRRAAEVTTDFSISVHSPLIHLRTGRMAQVRAVFLSKLPEWDNLCESFSSSIKINMLSKNYYSPKKTDRGRTLKDQYSGHSKLILSLKSWHLIGVPVCVPAAYDCCFFSTESIICADGFLDF